MRTSPEQIAEDLKYHLADCLDFRKLVQRELEEAREAREEMARDVKKVLAFMNHSTGFLRAVIWIGVVGSGLVTAGAWVFDHLPRLR